MKHAAVIGALTLVSIVGVALVAATVLPFVHTTWWLVRILGFPRLLFGFGLLAVALALVPFGWRFPRITTLLGTGVVAALVTNAAILWPYKPGVSSATASCPAERTLSVMIANVQLGNRTSAPLVEAVAERKPDLFLAMETDEWWDKALTPIEADMPNTVKKITGSYYGIHLFSRLPLVRPAIHAFADRDTPSVVTDVTLRNGETLTFIGIHPKPPLPGQSSMGRDAELYAAGQMLRQRTGLAVLGGDLNATPWEEAVERMRRLAGLDDPRRGYGYVASWNANLWWARWPLDNIFVRGDFDLLSLDRLGFIGSDHFPIMVRLCRRTGAAPVEPVPESQRDRDVVDEAFGGAGVRPAAR